MILAEETTTQAAEPNAWERFWTKVGEFFMTPDASGLNYLTRILISIGIIVVGVILIKLLGVVLKKAFGVKKKGPHIDKSAKFFVVELIKVFLYIALAFVVIAMLKIDVTGVAGITSAITVALGLALQDLISGFAAGLLIIQQKNFISGEYIKVTNSYGSCEGVVNKVHFFFTYLSTPQGQEITVPNSNMLKAVVTNYTRLGKRRIDFDVGVAYDTDIKEAKAALRSIVDHENRILEGTDITIYVYELGQYSVGIRLRVWTSPNDYWPLYNELPERTLMAFRARGIRIPSITEIQVQEK